ncbi:MAG: NAD-dependent malic enzyme [Anaerolineales bacterium]|nr:NAD-dependent malic enzyme [Anaerolineales bacterium]
MRQSAPPPDKLVWVHDPARNKGTAFTETERDALGLRGLLPPRVTTLQQQTLRVLENLLRKPNDLEKYIFLMGLLDRNETLFYRVLVDHLAELLPIVYTPTVGQACQEYGHIFRRPRGMFLSYADRGRQAQLLSHWPTDGVRVIVVTDGERILGLGDLGANGMGIPIGKLALYTALAGIPPSQCLPVTLDVGTENETLLRDPLYIGLPQRRIRGAAYDEFFEEFIAAAVERFPGVLVQMEDFGNLNAFRLLRAYRGRLCLFNDDIQGTGAVALAGLCAALRITGGRLADQTIVFLGAGEAGIGIGDMTAAALAEEGLSLEEARRRCWFVDSKGLVVRGRTDLNEDKRRYAHDHPFLPDLLSAVEALRPTAIVGAAGKRGMFPRPVLEAMARNHERPIVFALSNPTSKQECTAEEAYAATEGRAIFASGSPSAPQTVGGKEIVPGQGNNAYIFPGVGLAIVACGITRVTDEMFLAAAKALAREVSESDLAQGSVYPRLERIRAVAAEIATAAAETAYRQGLAAVPRPADLPAHIRSQMYDPIYPSYG